MLQPNPQYQYQRLTATGLIKSGGGLLGGFLVASGAPVISVYNNITSPGGVMVQSMAAVAGTYYPLDVLFTRGCYVVISGAGDVTFLYN